MSQFSYILDSWSLKLLSSSSSIDDASDGAGDDIGTKLVADRVKRGWCPDHKIPGVVHSGTDTVDSVAVEKMAVSTSHNIKLICVEGNQAGKALRSPNKIMLICLWKIIL